MMQRTAISIGGLGLLVASLATGCSQPQPIAKTPSRVSAAPSPGDAIRAWNDALAKGDLKTAERLTSSTSRDHIKQNFGSLEQLSATYQRNQKDKKMETKIIHEEISGDTAVVVYRVQYGDQGVKYWMDKLLREGGDWKVATQFVQTTTLRE